MRRKVDAEVTQKTVEAAVDNAAIAREIQRDLLERLQRIAMKYPRNDVEISETAIVLSEEETDDLMDEFDKEYRKYHRNWAEDPPEYDHPRGDHGNDLFRIEKKTKD
jgi:hypothetical protein